MNRLWNESLKMILRTSSLSFSLLKTRSLLRFGPTLSLCSVRALYSTFEVYKGYLKETKNLCRSPKNQDLYRLTTVRTNNEDVVTPFAFCIRVLIVISPAWTNRCIIKKRQRNSLPIRPGLKNVKKTTERSIIPSNAILAGYSIVRKNTR